MFPVSESASDRILRLPLYPTLDEREQASVVTTVLGFFGIGS
jgi:dTDP-4-amino-4,6-dideoxygalactose transaminase